MHTIVVHICMIHYTDIITNDLVIDALSSEGREDALPAAFIPFFMTYGSRGWKVHSLPPFPCMAHGRCIIFNVPE